MNENKNRIPTFYKNMHFYLNQILEFIILNDFFFFFNYFFYIEQQK